MTELCSPSKAMAMGLAKGQVAEGAGLDERLGDKPVAIVARPTLERWTHVLQVARWSGRRACSRPS